jgi:hypothetical protein
VLGVPFTSAIALLAGLAEATLITFFMSRRLPRESCARRAA